jgi:type II secretion system protein G
MSKRGFTLIELLVVISIIGLLSSVVIASLNASRNKAKVAQARSQLIAINAAINLLRNDTGQWPAHLTDSPCSQDPETSLQLAAGGLVATDGSFPNWQGPYMAQMPLDPWGSNYYFDGDYTCGPAIDGCKHVNYTIRVILSFGPDKEPQYSTGDDIVHMLCY